MKSYICTKELYLDKYDDDGFLIENDYCSYGERKEVEK